MNLFFRMLYVLLLASRRPRLAAGKVTSTLTLLTFPNDLDVNLHVNCGRYLTLCDLSRVDLFLRTGLFRLMLRRRWQPIIADHTMTYLKPLAVFRKVDLILDLTHWDERYFYMEHRFERGGKVFAKGTSKGVIRGKACVVPPQEVIDAIVADSRPAP
jgi:acyl-CoA thioesterase FadM